MLCRGRSDASRARGAAQPAPRRIPCGVPHASLAAAPRRTFHHQATLQPYTARQAHRVQRARVRPVARTLNKETDRGEVQGRAGCRRSKCWRRQAPPLPAAMNLPPHSSRRDNSHSGLGGQADSHRRGLQARQGGRAWGACVHGRTGGGAQSHACAHRAVRVEQHAPLFAGDLTQLGNKLGRSG